MGLLSAMRKRRQERKAIYKAAKVRAKAEAKETSKLELQKEKYLRKTAKQVRKFEAKELKQRRKHEQAMAKSAVQQLKNGTFNAQNVARYAGAARVAAPVALPIIYRLLNQLRNSQEVSVAHRAGVVPADMAKYAQDGAAHKARIDRIRKSVDKGNVPTGFAKDVNDRMDTLEKAVDNSKSMGDAQTKDVLGSISRDLDLVEAQIAQKRH